MHSNAPLRHDQCSLDSNLFKISFRWCHTSRPDNADINSQFPKSQHAHPWGDMPPPGGPWGDMPPPGGPWGDKPPPGGPQPAAKYATFLGEKSLTRSLWRHASSVSVRRYSQSLPRSGIIISVVVGPAKRVSNVNSARPCNTHEYASSIRKVGGNKCGTLWYISHSIWLLWPPCQ